MLLEQILASDNLQQAWKRVKQNKGAAGVDGMTLDQYPSWAKAHWKGVKRGLERGYYCPQPVKPYVSGYLSPNGKHFHRLLSQSD